MFRNNKFYAAKLFAAFIRVESVKQLTKDSKRFLLDEGITNLEHLAKFNFQNHLKKASKEIKENVKNVQAILRGILDCKKVEIRFSKQIAKPKIVLSYLEKKQLIAIIIFYKLLISNKEDATTIKEEYLEEIYNHKKDARKNNRVRKNNNGRYKNRHTQKSRMYNFRQLKNY